jgi:hypothetical protein
MPFRHADGQQRHLALHGGFVFRMRIAANVLCEWTSASGGRRLEDKKGKIRRVMKRWSIAWPAIESNGKHI